MIIKNNIYMKRFYYFNLYVIKGTNGDILIDTGFVFMKKRVKKWLDNFNIKLIILTHAHIDHIWNAKYLKDCYKAKIAMGKNDVINIDNSRINAKALKKKYYLYTKVMNLGMKTLKPQKFEIDYLLKDNDVINKYGLSLKIIELSGHTEGSIGIFYKNVLFAGDSLVNRGKPSLPYQSQSPKKTVKSAKKIINLKPELILLGHDKPVVYDELKKQDI